MGIIHHKYLVSQEELTDMPSCLQGQTFVGVVKKEGARSLYLGLTPALSRSVVYGGLRLGLYEPSKKFCELAFESTDPLLNA